MNETKTAELYYLYKIDPNKPISVCMGMHSCDRTYFSSVLEARESNYQGTYKNRAKYKIGKVEIVTSTHIIDADVDPASLEEIIKNKIEEDENTYIQSKVEEYAKTINTTNVEDYMGKLMSYEIDLRFIRTIEKFLTK
jgi:hypothetical protein